jgi:hypothetical protein
MQGPSVECPTCRAPADHPCTGPDGRPCAGVHTERVLAAVKAMFGHFSPPVPEVNGPKGEA